MSIHQWLFRAWIIFSSWHTIRWIHGRPVIYNIGIFQRFTGLNLTTRTTPRLHMLQASCQEITFRHMFSLPPDEALQYYDNFRAVSLPVTLLKLYPPITEFIPIDLWIEYFAAFDVEGNLLPLQRYSFSFQQFNVIHSNVYGFLIQGWPGCKILAQAGFPCQTLVDFDHRCGAIFDSLFDDRYVVPLPKPVMLATRERPQPNQPLPEEFFFYYTIFTTEVQLDGFDRSNYVYRHLLQEQRRFLY